MSTTKTTIRSLAVVAVLGLTSACAATSPASEVPQEGAPDETEGDRVVLPEERYRLQLECPRPGGLLPC
jgi:hypothetical protein